MAEKINIKFCPKCEGTNINMTAGGLSGGMECAGCGFTSVVFPEKEIDLDEVNEKAEEDKEKYL